MGKKGDGYGSEDHFLTYRKTPASDLDAKFLAVTGLRGEVEWIYPDLKHPEMKELKGVNFLPDKAPREAWKGFWPQTGNQQRWDGVAKVGERPCSSCSRTA